LFFSFFGQNALASVLENSLIATREGDVLIQSLPTGHKIFSYDLNYDWIEEAPITKLTTSSCTQMHALELEFVNNDTTVTRGILCSCSEQLFYNPVDQSWIKAQNLKPETFLGSSIQQECEKDRFLLTLPCVVDLMLETSEGKRWIIAEYKKIINDPKHRSKTEEVNGFVYEGGLLRWVWWKLFGNEEQQYYTSGYQNRIAEIAEHIKEENKEKGAKEEEKNKGSNEDPNNEGKDAKEEFDQIVRDVLRGAKPGAKTKGRTKQSKVPPLYHPHGDQAIYQTMVGMVQEDYKRYPMVQLLAYCYINMSKSELLLYQGA
jgi:hypothetical protein